MFRLSSLDAHTCTGTEVLCSECSMLNAVAEIMEHIMPKSFVVGGSNAGHRRMVLLPLVIHWYS